MPSTRKRTGNARRRFLDDGADGRHVVVLDAAAEPVCHQHLRHRPRRTCSGRLKHAPAQRRRAIRTSCRRTAVPEASIGRAVVRGAPAADRVEVLEREPERIHQRGSSRTPDCARCCSMRSRIDCALARRLVRAAARWRRRRWRRAEDVGRASTCRAAPATCGWLRRDRQNAALPEQAAARHRR